MRSNYKFYFFSAVLVVVIGWFLIMVGLVANEASQDMEEEMDSCGGLVTCIGKGIGEFGRAVAEGFEGK